MTSEKPPQQLQLGGENPWIPRRLPLADEKKEQARQALLAALERSEHSVIEQRVALVLRDFPETRDDDVELVIRYWQRFDAAVLERSRPLDLDILHELERFDSITRARRRIQNDLGLFEATLFTQNQRSERQQDFFQYATARRSGDPEIRFYLDETGTDPKEVFLGIGGVCTIDWRAFELQHAALTSWREKQGWPGTLHLTDAGDAEVPMFLELLSQVQSRRAGLLFLGYSIAARKGKREVLLTLFVQLITDSLRRLEQLGCLNNTKAVSVIKEAEQGFDQLLLDDLRQTLEEQFAREFQGRVYLSAVTPLPKGREVLLEVADAIAGGMRRRALFAGQQRKDLIADAVMNVTGFEDTREQGALYRAFP